MNVDKQQSPIMIAREDTRRARVEITREKREKISRAHKAWRDAQTQRRENTRFPGVTVRQAGPVEVITIPLVHERVEFYAVVVSAMGKAIDWTTRMSESQALRKAEEWERMYASNGVVAQPTDTEIVV